MNSYSSSEILQQATVELQQAHIKEARFEAELLLSHLLNVPKEYFVHQNMSIDNNIYTEFKELIAKRKTRCPIQYLLGEWEFWSFQLLISEGVFIPRPE